MSARRAGGAQLSLVQDTAPDERASYGPQVLAYFAAHAIDPVLAAELDVRERGGALIYPYGDATGPFERVRPLGTGAKTRQPPGRKLCCWWPAGRPERAAGVLVYEGEGDGLAAETARRASRGIAREILDGVQVVVVPGASFPVDRLAGELQRVGAERVILAPDADRAGDGFATRAADALEAAGVATARLPLSEGRDLADCLAAAGAERGEWLANAVADLDYSVPSWVSRKPGVCPGG